MRINKYVAAATGMSRRAADQALAEGRVLVNGAPAVVGATVSDNTVVTLDGTILHLGPKQTIILHKPIGYVVSRQGQGSRTVYDLLPSSLHTCKPVGRLDKDSSGLLLMTTDGDLAQQLTHPSRQKRKRYLVTLDQPLQPLHRQIIAERGIALADGPSQLGLERQHDGNDRQWIITMHEGRNRQIRRTFEALGYKVTKLHRTNFGDYNLGDLAVGHYREV